MGWWESNGNILICTSQLERFFLLFTFKPTFQPTFTSIILWFSVLLPHNLVSDICQTFCTSSGRHLYLCACLYPCLFVCKWLYGLFYFLCLWVMRKSDLDRDSWHPFRHCLTSLSRTIMLLYTHPCRASGVKCLNLKFGTNITRCFIHTWNEMKS